jgi:dolichol-phosphate mannosyltransferase
MMSGDLPDILDVPVVAAPAGPLMVPPSPRPGVGFSLVVPTFNEAGNIIPFLAALRETLDAALGDDYEVIVIDDESPDGTGDIAAKIAFAYPQLRVVRRRGERGLARAVIRGWQLATGEILGTINADLQHPPDVLGKMIPRMREADLVVASRFAEGGGLGDWAMHRRINSRVAHSLGRIILPQAFCRSSDPLSGCYIFRRDAIAGAELHPLGFKTLMEIMVRGNFARVREVSYEMRSRQRGSSKLRMRHWFDYLFHLLRLRRAALLQGLRPR